MVEPVDVTGPLGSHHLRLPWLHFEDPGLQRLTHALKTMLAALIATGLLHQQPLRSRLLGATAAIFLMQCVGKGGKRYQCACMLLCGVAMTTLSFVTAHMHGLPYAREVIIVLVAFLCFYARTHMPDAGTFPIYVFSLVVLVTAFPPQAGQEGSQTLAVALGLVIALPLAFLVDPQWDFPRQGPSASLRTAVRAALAAAIALILQHLLDLPRGYWCVLVAVVITSDTRSDHLVKATDRLLMTVLGCVIGWLLLLACGQQIDLKIGFLIVGVLGSVYYRNASYRLMTFFISIYVVFLLAMYGQWSADILLVRCGETALGCMVSLSTWFMLPYDPAARLIPAQARAEALRAAQDNPRGGGSRK